MQQYSDVVQDHAGSGLSGVPVTIYSSAGAMATLYADTRGTATIANPLTTNANGRFSFYAPAGNYDIWVAGQIQQTVTLLDVQAGQSTAPTWPGTDREFVPNTTPTVLGPTGGQYLIDGWRWIGGASGAWMAIPLSVTPVAGIAPAPAPTPAPAPGPAPAPTPAPTPAPAPVSDTGTLYTARVQGEAMTGATALNSSQIAAIGIPSGYDGTGLADEDTTAGQIKTATFSGARSGVYTINFGFFAFGAQQNSIQIDSGTVTSYMFTPGSSGYGVVSIPNVTLTAGAHTVSFVSEWGFVYPDYVEIVQTSTVTPVQAVAAAPAPATSGTAPFYPFGSRLDGAYPHAITITGYTLPQQDALLTGCYDKWKAARVRTADALGIAGGYYVDAPETIIEPDPVSGYPGQYSLTVSEAMGYGMLLTVVFAGYDANARAIFDGMHKVVRARPAYAQGSAGNANLYLMDWRIGTRSGPTGAPIDLSSQGAGYNACDGDMDIARAYLMAHRQWGSSGAVNYYQEALNTIGALKAANFDASGIMYVPPIGQRHDVSRTSDYMIGHFRDFKKATNDTFWDTARTASLSLLAQVIASASPTAHLPPDWIWKPLTTPQASPGNQIEGPFEGYFAQNAVRDPWRLASDYIFSGDTACHDIASNIVTTIKTKAAGDPNATSWMYDLAGNQPAGTNLYYEPTTVGCTMAGALVDAAHQSWLNACFTKLTASFNTSYFSSELSLLPLVVASGNWWRP